MKHAQRCVGDKGQVFLHVEKPSRKLGKAKVIGHEVGTPGMDGWDSWENDIYYGSLRRYDSGFGIGGGPYAIIGISAIDESAKHDWRDFQKIKNDLVGKDWEAVELYPAEDRLVDPSNRFYLYCAPKGVFTFGFTHRQVLEPLNEGVPQRPFAED